MEVTVRGLDEATAQNLADRADSTHRVGELWAFIVPDQERAHSVLKAVLAQDAEVVRVTPVRRSLETIFVEQATQEVSA